MLRIRGHQNELRQKQCCKKPGCFLVCSACTHRKRRRGLGWGWTTPKPTALSSISQTVVEHSIFPAYTAEQVEVGEHFSGPECDRGEGVLGQGYGHSCLMH